jgi:CRISPR-associated protein Csm1
MKFDQREYQAVILAALLHDVGKISQREGGQYYAKHAEFSGNFISSLKGFFGSDLAREVANLIEKHHKTPTERDEYILHIADKLAAAERFKEERPRFKSNEAALLAVTSRIRLKRDCKKEKYYKLDSVRLEEGTLFPSNEPQVQEGAYNKVWDRFIDKVRSLGTYQSSDFRSLYFILKEVGSFVPSATPWEDDEYNRTVPDVSLFDHSKVTCAIAACLKVIVEKELPNAEMSEIITTLRKHYRENDPKAKEEILNSCEPSRKPIFILLRADIAGIQKFVYSITKPQAEAKGTSKRLRGRSFYISLLTEVVSDWIIREIELPITNILFCGGGRFDLLVPNTDLIKGKLEDIQKIIDGWLLKEFYGELSIQFSAIQVAPRDFFEFDQVYQKAEDKLAESKMRKFEEMFKGEDFFHSTEEVSDLCNSCLIVPVSKGQMCRQCQTQLELGSNLPKKEFLSFAYSLHEPSIGLPIVFDKFGVTVFLQDGTEMKRFLKGSGGTELCIYRTNPEFEDAHGLDFLQENRDKKSISFGFKFLGNSAPLAVKDFNILPKPKEPVRRGEVLEFEEIAELSSGAKYLGVLKMDVDHLGLLFSLGIESPSISRIATLSSNFEIFFNAWLNTICEKVTRRWSEGLSDNDPRKGLVESLFYTVYSGGDDLFIVGPWTQIIELAGEIYRDFVRYTSDNPNITVSGAILFVKPAFPVQRFSLLVGEQLDKSKKGGRDRVTIFNETVEWREGTKSFESLVTFGKELVREVENKERPLSKSFVYFLRRLEGEYRIGTDEEDINWIPQFIYSHTRRVRKEVEEKLALRSQVMEKRGRMKIPVYYVSLITRKERRR